MITLTITYAGIMSCSSPNGMHYRFTRFKLGAGYGYPVTGFETDLRGPIVVDQALPDSAVTQIQRNTLVVDLAPDNLNQVLSFGEIGIYTDTGVLAAIAVAPTPYVTSGLAGDLIAGYALKCFLRFAIPSSVVIDAKGDFISDDVATLTTKGTVKGTINGGASVNTQYLCSGLKVVDNKGMLSDEVHNATTPSMTLNTNFCSYFKFNVTTDVTFSLVTTPVVANTASIFVVELKNAGAYDVKWWPGVLLPNGAPPVYSVTGTDIITFYQINGTWIAVHEGASS